MLERRRIDVAGVGTSYVDTGSGCPIVLLHGCDIGWGSTGLMVWQRNIAALAEHHRVIAVDRLGHGYTDNPLTPEQYRLSATSAHLVAFLERLNVREATVVGQSRGAFVAAHLPLLAPGLVRRLVLTNTSAFATGSADARLDTTAPVFQGLAETAEADFHWYSADTSYLTPEWIGEATEILRQPKTLQGRATFEEQRGAYFAELAELRDEILRWYPVSSLETLLIWGAADPSTELSLGVDLRAALGPGTDLYVMGGAGHLCFAERPVLYNRLLTHFAAG
ncbi:alpha/beta fold hydrolase [Sporichthya brevicatena]|uniref:Alpha/beta fold hydrolase n=2 Tax=Sporichthya brevicatena TaxID=171442 RepID=A0ABP3RK22_9ACTN